MEIAGLQEKNVQAMTKTQKTNPKPFFTSSTQNFQKTTYNPRPETKWSNPQHKTSNQPKALPPKQFNQFKKITPAEFNAKREKGLCYKCEEPYSYGHVCKNASVNFILAAKPDDQSLKEDAMREEGEKFCDCEEEEHSEEELMEISMQALTGGIDHKTLRIAGLVGKKPISILIDSGSTHSFIDEKLAQELKYETSEIQPLSVTVANGEKMNSKPLKQPLQWQM